jgi:hypothetical protein
LSQQSSQAAQLVHEADDDSPPVPNINLVEENLNALAGTIRLPAYAKSRNVREQFSHAFDLIGGIPRLAMWAHQNPDKFYQLYSKLIPAQVTGADGGPLRVELSWINARDTSGRVPTIVDVTPTKE